MCQDPELELLILSQYWISIKIATGNNPRVTESNRFQEIQDPARASVIQETQIELQEEELFMVLQIIHFNDLVNSAVEHERLRLTPAWLLEAAVRLDDAFNQYFEAEAADLLL